METNFIILDFGKVFIVYENNERKFYKETEKGLIILSEEEKKILDEIFNNSKYNEYYSKRIENILIKNNKIENKDYIINFLNYLESIIPETCRDNFYRNLETLEVRLNFDFDISNIKSVSENDNVAGRYNVKKNILYLAPSSLKELWDIAQKTNDPYEFYWKHVNLDVLHELSHVASSKYDETKEIVLCGFDRFPASKQSDSNRGLTEGMTEIIAMSGIPGTIEISSGYYIEATFVNQLMHIVGKDVMLESFFANKGSIELEKELDKYGNENLDSKLLFRRIEDNFYLNNFRGKQGILAGIQANLIEHYKNKMLFCIRNNLISADEVNQSLISYESILLTPQKIILMKKDPNYYIGLEDSIKNFYSTKEQINNELENMNKNTHAK